MNGLEVHQHHLAYAQKLELRSTASLILVVIHCTELPDLEMAREYGERVHYPLTGTGNSGHYYVDRDGRVEEWVPLDRVAHHVRDYNERSIGIELVNRGRYPDWFNSAAQTMTEPYPFPQIDALTFLLISLAQKLPSLRWIAGHERLDTERVPAADNPDIEVYRKRDPGPLFPWMQVLNDTSLVPMPADTIIR